MSFGAGMGAGMGAGIGAGIAIGVASGQKQAVERIRNYLAENELSIRDRMGKEVPVDSVLNAVACKQHKAGAGGNHWVIVLLTLALLGGLGLLGVVYLVMR